MGPLVQPPAVPRLGGPTGNEILTSATALVLAALLAVEGITILFLGPLLRPHMFIGVLLIPPVALKLASTGYRFARYYTRSDPYRDKGPPQRALRLLAPLLVITTILVFATGIVLLVDGHKSGSILELHKVAFIVWSAAFGVHFLAYLPRVLRSLRSDWTARRRRLVPGSGARLAAVFVSVCAGVVVALALLSPIDGWSRGERGHPHASRGAAEHPSLRGRR